MIKYKYVISDSYNPYWNLATEERLLSMTEPDTVILYLWQNENTIVVGRNQDVYAECKVDEFQNSGGMIARRKSGGGAVYHDLGNLNFSFLSRESLSEKYNYREFVFQALRVFGIQAEFNGRNDLTVVGKKISGTAVYDNGTSVCRHGTLLVSTDLDKMTKVLTPDADKLKRNGVKSVASRVRNLSEDFPQVTVADLQTALIQVTEAEQLDLKNQKEEIQKLADLYAKNDWIFGGSFA